MSTIITFGDLVNFVASRVGASRQDLTRIDEYCFNALRQVWRRFQWPERRRKGYLEIPASDDLIVDLNYQDGLVRRAGGDPWVPGTWVGWTFIQFGNPGYEVIDVPDPDTMALGRPFLGETQLSAGAFVYQDTFQMPDDFAEVVEDELLMLWGEGYPLDWIDQVEGRRLAPYLVGPGRPWWATEGPRVRGDDNLYDKRSLRFGPYAADVTYPVDFAYYCEYPELPDSEPDRSDAKLLIPEGRRDLCAWRALSDAYSEHPFTDGTQMERFEGRYERELDVALRSEKEAVTDVTYLEAFDR